MAFIDADNRVAPAFAELMLKMAAAYPSARLTETQIQVYAALLGDFTLSEVSRAFTRTARERSYQQAPFFPSAAEILQVLRPSPDDTALLAWSALSRAAAEVGAYASLECEDGRAAAALEAVFGGWPEFCRFEDGPALALKRQEFLAAYRDARRRPMPSRRLVGLCEGDRLSPELAAHVWAGRISAGGQVTTVRCIASAPMLSDTTET